MNTPAPAPASVQLTPEQMNAIDTMMMFIADPSPASTMFTLNGGAGTGKTFCMREVLARIKYSKAKFAFTAPTNKAAKVLRAITGEAQTIYSLLGLRIDKSGELKQLVAGKAAPDLSDYSVIFIDEGGMVNSMLFKLLAALAKQFSLKVIFIGDAAQLPPVGEACSPIWEQVQESAELTKVMRHDNAILTLANELREAMDAFAPSINIKTSHKDDEGVWKMTKAAFKESIYTAAAKGEFADGVKSKVIAWRNVRVAEYNYLIRQALHGAEAGATPYLTGERIVASSPCIRGEEMLATDEEAVVESAVVCQHPLEPKYKAIELTCLTENKSRIRLMVAHPAGAQAYNNDCELLAAQARANPKMGKKLWEEFWALKELFHEVKYAYALTAHRAQGSTYENVWVDYQDILLNRTRKEAFQCLYVACTRPQKKLFLA